MDSLVVEAMALSDAEMGWSGLRTAEGMVCRKCFRGSHPEPFECCWPPGVGLPGRVLADKIPYLTNDATKDGVVDPKVREKLGVRSAIGTPVLNVKGEVIGFFEVVNKKGDLGFSDRDLETLAAVAQSASVAMQNALAYQELRRTEQALRASEGRVRLALRAARMGTWERHLATEETIWSVETEKMFGLPPGSFPRTHGAFLACVHPEDRGLFSASMRRRGTEDASRSAEYRIVWPDGTVRWIAGRGEVQYDEAGLPRDVLGVVVDVTEQKAAQEALARRAAQLQGLAEASLAINSATTLDEVLKCLTQRAREIVGAHMAVVGLTVDGTWAQDLACASSSDKLAAYRDFDARPEVSAIHALVCETNRPLRVTQNDLAAHPAWPGLGKHARSHPPLRGWLAVPLVGGAGQNIGVLQLSDKHQGGFTAEDEAIVVQLAQMASVTIERVRLNQTLGESEERLRQMADSIPEVFYIVDGNLTHTYYVSPAYETVWGRSCESLYQHPHSWAEAIHPEDRERAWAAAMQAQRGQDPGRREYRVIRPDGSQRWVWDQTFSVRDEHGEVCRIVGIARDITERKQAEEQIRFQASLLEQVRNAVIAVDLEGQIVYWNKGAETLYQWKATEAMGRDFTELLVAPEDSGRAAGIVGILKAAGHWEGELVPLRKNRTRLPVYSVNSVLRDAEGNMTGFLGVAQDITERKQAEEELRRSEERWRAVFENSGVGIALVNPKGVFTAANRAYQDMLGYTEEELRALAFMDITCEEDRQANWALCTELWGGKRRQFQHEKRYRRKDGKLIWVRSTVSLASGTEAVPRFAMSIVEDITERKRAETALARERNVLRTLIDNLPDFIYVKDAESRFVVANEAVAHCRGLKKAEEALGKTDFHFYPRSLAAQFFADEQQIIRSGQPLINKEEPGQDAAGNKRWVSTTKVPLRNNLGQVVGLVGMGRDITGRKQAEEQLGTYLLQLRALAGRLQRVREEERLRISREIHDELAQSCTALKMGLGWLSGKLPKDQKELLKKARSMTKLVEDIIQSSRRIAAELRPGVLDDLGLVAAIEWEVQQFHARTGIKSQVTLPKERSLSARSAPSPCSVSFRKR